MGSRRRWVLGAVACMPPPAVCLTAHLPRLPHCPLCSPQCGYLYLSDPQRLHDMMGLLGLGDGEAPESGLGGTSGGGGEAGGGSSGS